MGERHYLEVGLIDGAPQGYKRVDFGADYSPLLVGQDKVFSDTNSPAPVVVILQPVLVGKRLGLLTGKRAVDPCLGWWSMPAGHVEKGEDALTAAARELAEECGFETLNRPNTFSLLSTRPSHDGAKLLIFVQNNMRLQGDVTTWAPTREMSAFRVLHFGDDALPFPVDALVADDWLLKHRARDTPDQISPSQYR